MGASAVGAVVHVKLMSWHVFGARVAVGDVRAMQAHVGKLRAYRTAVPFERVLGVGARRFAAGTTRPSNVCE